MSKAAAREQALALLDVLDCASVPITILPSFLAVSSNAWLLPVRWR
jgi:hypothetical protein